ncbi:GDP/GTP exchange factor for ARF [Entophlyctis luteolus]|nr:GDP/GTP exchange factor for ARF [Entophlyctis luteolus]
MERFSAILQRKEQELLLEREREAAADSGSGSASTFELKLLIQKKYNETRRIEEQLLQESTQSLLAQEPQVARKNVLGVLARRVKAAQDAQAAAAAAASQPASPSSADADGDPIRPSLDAAVRASSPASPLDSSAQPSFSPPSRYDSDSEYVRRESSIANLRNGGNWSSDEEDDDDYDFAAGRQGSSSRAIDGRNEGDQGQRQQASSLTVVVPSRSTSKGALTKSFSSRNNRVPGLPLPQKDTRKGLANLDSAGTRSKPSSSNSRAPMVTDDGDEFIIRDEYTDISDSGGEESPQFLSPEIPRSNQASSLSRSVTLKPREACERTLFLDGPAWNIATISSLKECYLFLLTDILVITKPYERRTTKRMYFKPLTIMKIRNCCLTFNDSKAKHPNNGLLLLDSETRHRIETVVSRTFESHPVKSISYLISKGIFPRTPTAVATFLLTTPRLSKTALGKFLALQSHTQILTSYLRFFEFQGKDLITSFRMLLCSLRLPIGESEKVNAIIEAFVERWLVCNPKSMAKISPPANTRSKNPTPSTPLENVPLEKHWQHDAVQQVVSGLLALDYEIHYSAPARKGTNTMGNRGRDLADISNKFIWGLLPSLQSSLKTRPDYATVTGAACEKTHREALITIFNDILEERLDIGDSSSRHNKSSGYLPSAPPFSFFTVQKTAPAVGTAYSDSGSITTGSSSSSTPSPLQAGNASDAAYIAFTTTTPFLNLTVGEASPRITLSLSQPVPGLVLEASGVNVSAEPRVLDFSRGAVSVSFTVTGATVGRKVLLFTRLRGAIAASSSSVADAAGGGVAGTDVSFADATVAGGDSSDASTATSTMAFAAAAAARRRLELPAGIGVLVEPTWLKFRFAVEEFADDAANSHGGVRTNQDGTDAGTDTSTKGELINTQVLAVSTEMRFNEWEQMFKKILLSGRSSGGGGGVSRGSPDNGDEPLSKNVMVLKGNNPYGTHKVSNANSGFGGKASSSNLAAAAARAAYESAEKIVRLKELLLDREHPLSRNELLKLLGAE